MRNSYCLNWLIAILSAMATISARADYQSTVLSDNPLGYWPLNFSEDTNTAGGYSIATDFSGNGNYGTYYNITPANTVPGPTAYITNAVSFNAAEVDLSTGPNTSLLNFTGPTTLEAWAQPADSTTFGDIIGKGYDSDNYQEIALRENGVYGANYFGYFGTGGLSGGQQNTQWVYIVLSNDGTNDYLYINGQLVASAADTTGSIAFSNPDTWAIGNGTSGGDGREFYGNLCQVAMYDHGLTAAQVLKHYFAAELNASPATSRPIIITQPQSQSSFVGGSATFTVTAVSGLSTTNQWYEGSTPLPGQTGTSLTLNNLQLTNAGNYSVVVGNANGTTNSLSATLTVSTPNHLEWTANGNNGQWDVDTSANWLNLSNDTQTVFNQGDNVLFDDTPGVPTSVTVSGTVTPSLITVNTSTNTFDISSGAISGSGSLVKLGTSPLTITSAGSFTGTATIAGGSFYAGNNCLRVISAITVTNNATLDFGGGQFNNITPATVSGTGVNGEGALYNSYDDYPVEQLNITLAGDTSFGGANRWDLGSGSQISGPHNLTVDWSSDADSHYAQWNSLTIGNVLGITVTNAQAANGVTNSLGFSGMDDSFQNPSTVMTVCTNDQLVFYGGGFNGSIHLESGAAIDHYSAPGGFYGSTLVMDEGSTFESYYNTGDTTPIDSAVTLNGVVHFVVGDHYMDYTNVVSGVGGFVLDNYNNAMQFSASNTYSGPTVIGSSGNTPIVALTGNGSITHSSLIFFGGNDPTVSHIDVSGRSDQTFTLANDQILEGIGGINGSLVVSSGAIISPGGTNTTIGITTGANPVGILAASDNVTLNGTTLIKLDGTTNDEIEAAANITYGGTLNLANVSSSPLTAGSSFQIFSAATYSGSFTSISPASPGTGLAWNTSQLSSGIISVVSSGTGPVVSSTYTSGGNFIFSGTGGSDNGTYYVLTSTNLLTPLSQWTPIATNSFNGSGGFSVTNSLSGPQRFYIIRQ
ncbi:MAG TPA: LamG-like jellyroll fold domain-containing protein [Candidatus Sulfotelmatobacter sp.]|nr:LamG-like jellyroll fold domain-containing protein [Candidatus Sulfotelmatobacter sp.]